MLGAGVEGTVISLVSGGGGVLPPIMASNPPDVFLDFAGNKAFGGGTAASKLTCVRAAPSGAGATTDFVNDSFGVWAPVAANLPRISNLGLLVEESRINSIRNNSMQGAVAGTPGTLPTNWSTSNNSGLAPNVIGTGTQNGIDYIDVQVVGTASLGTTNINFDTSTAIAATNGQTWAQSVFLAVVGGDQTNISSIQLVESLRAAGGSFLSNTAATVTVGSSFTRQSQIPTLSNASLAFVMPGITLNTAAGAINITLRLGWPQLEQGASVTSPIRTTSAAVTRAADVVTLTSPPSFGSAYSIYAASTPQTPTSYTSQWPLQLTDGTAAERTGLRRPTGTGTAQTLTTHTSVDSIQTGATWAQSTAGKIAYAVANADQQGCFNGTLSSAGAATAPNTMTTVNIGMGHGGLQQWNGFISQTAIWRNARVSNGFLQSITT